MQGQYVVVVLCRKRYLYHIVQAVISVETSIYRSWNTFRIAIKLGFTFSYMGLPKTKVFAILSMHYAVVMACYDECKLFTMWCNKFDLFLVC